MQITFKRPVQFIGRNGCFKSIGLDISVVTPKNIVCISPITSKGIVANCLIEVPLEEFSKTNLDVWMKLQAAKLQFQS